MRTVRLTLIAAILICGAAPALAVPAGPVLADSSFWRYSITYRRPAVIGGAILPVKVTYRSYPGLTAIETPPPPADWTAPEFQDADWPRAPAAGSGSIAEVMSCHGIEFCMGAVSLRGKFAVADPAAVRDLALSLTYRGGVVVYLNGREVARQDLPAGPLTAATPGAPYPPDAFTNPKAAHDRSLGPVGLPAGALRKGANVLAIEVHRSDYQPAAAAWFAGPEARGAWVPIGLANVRLTASAGATPNVGRPAGLQVWGHDLNDRVTPFDYGDPNEPTGTLRLVGARNGAFSGQVVAGSPAAIQGLTATMSDLVRVPPGPKPLSLSGRGQGEGERPAATPEVTPSPLPSPSKGEGEGRIPASQVRIRYALVTRSRNPVFDALADTAPAEVPVYPAAGAVQPVWITVRVPRDAAPGDYQGTLTISAKDAQPVSVPVALSVADWALPDPVNYRTYVGIYQSPDTLALQYKVPIWSDKHWALMEKSFELLAQVGNKIVNIPLSDQTQFGNDEGMVYWVKKPDNSYDYDFTVFDRYLELVKKHLGVPDFVALQLWHSGGWEMRKADQQNTVTVVDPKAGTHERKQVPVFGTPESKAFWTPVLKAAKEHLAKAGMDQSMCLGILSDGTAPPAVFRMFDEIMPGIGWTRGCHSVTFTRDPYYLVRPNIGKVVCHEFCYGMQIADPAKGLPAIWKQSGMPGVAYNRHTFDNWLSLLKYRNMAERGLYCNTRGIGRICLDYWDVLKTPRGQGENLYNRYPFSSCGQRSPNLWRLAAPGPDGAVATVRFEQLREGLQDAEATIAVAEAQGDKAAQLGPDLAATCRQVYLDRLNYAHRTCPEPFGRVMVRANHQNWQDLLMRTYAAAAEAAKKTGGK